MKKESFFTELAYLDCEHCAIAKLSGIQNKTLSPTLMARNNRLAPLAVTGYTALEGDVS
ncbi:MAG: hypothetical protein IJG42_05785 [Muribaculaceae bacterium]|nr:hypothetical protein [Muribaculaceae bacterium]